VLVVAKGTTVCEGDPPSLLRASSEVHALANVLSLWPHREGRLDVISSWMCTVAVVGGLGVTLL
jgi:hypothetical protein